MSDGTPRVASEEKTSGDPNGEGDDRSNIMGVNTDFAAGHQHMTTRPITHNNVSVATNDANDSAISPFPTAMTKPEAGTTIAGIQNNDTTLAHRMNGSASTAVSELNEPILTIVAGAASTPMPESTLHVHTENFDGRSSSDHRAIEAFVDGIRITNQDAGTSDAMVVDVNTTGDMHSGPTRSLAPSIDSDDDMYTNDVFLTPTSGLAPDGVPEGAPSSYRPAAATGHTVPTAQQVRLSGIDAMRPLTPMSVDERPDDAGPGMAKQHEGTQDLVNRVHGMYRILDLVSEQGSGGLVDKIIISQSSLGRFINEVSPGAYTSLTKVDFAALDEAQIKPVGIYGSRSEIIRFLENTGAVDHETAQLLRGSKDEASAESPAILRSGLYILRSNTTEHVLHVIYWPQDTTWDDDAHAAIRRNRITFMRYLTKLADQVIALVSREHADSLVWNDPADEAETDLDIEEESDRLFAFEVAKTNEQDENVTPRLGFSFQHASIRDALANDDATVDPARLSSRLISGETSSAIMEVKVVPSKQAERYYDERYQTTRLENDMQKSDLVLDDRLSDKGLDILLRHGLDKRALTAAVALRKHRADAIGREKDSILGQQAELKTRLDVDADLLLHSVQAILIDHIHKKFTSLDREQLRADEHTENRERATAYIANLVEMYPAIKKEIDTVIKDKKLTSIVSQDFKLLKEKIFIIDRALAEVEADDVARRALVSTILDAGDLKRLSTTLESSAPKEGRSVWSLFGILPARDVVDRRITDGKIAASHIGDAAFLQEADNLVDRQPLLQEAVSQALRIAHEHLRQTLVQKAIGLSHRIRMVQEDVCNHKIQREAARCRESEIEQARARYLSSVKSSFISEGASTVLTVRQVDPVQSWNNHSFRIVGKLNTRSPPALHYSLHVLDLTQHDKHSLQMDKSHIPTPKMHSQSTASFQLPINHRIMHVQLLADSRCLLIVDSGEDNINIFLETVHQLGAAVQRTLTKKVIRKGKVGDEFLLSFDETKRMLAVCATSRGHPQLHVFAFDERYTTLQGIGSAVNLSPWYDGATNVLGITFVCGAAEEILFVDDGARARVFSLITQQFRPASIQLKHLPSKILSSPDGSCLLTVQRTPTDAFLLAYHWSNFGSTDGIRIDLDGFLLESAIVTSFVDRTNVHFIGLDPQSHRCQSISLDITRKITEFSFKAKGNGIGSIVDSAPTTSHNCLIDCHADVWTRFPVVPAVRRGTIVTSTGREPKQLLVIMHRNHEALQPYFSNLIASFEKTTRKPTEKELSGIIVRAINFEMWLQEARMLSSSFRAGEWLVDLLCLIPIHLAITKENRFVPLKDGVWSAELERSLLGAKVDHIIDSLSFGWYESIFRSYMALKPVKVVSSMGEQSVGKSFALNHLVDTSFAGSAMRTTEGVWMSVNPTNEALIVALDFEGVHSIERSAQEDTLLVLFNTAISNLVLFRNNFALSRDITGLFQSFQSSSTVLDPSANPSLFQSTLVIIIKDVVDSDKAEIAKEFSLKFQQIVQLEQGSNFITKLHRGRLNIIPWPVIESKQFYALFPTVKRILDRQPVTHERAGVFLQTLKTLMAKLKANDWGSLSQNLASHRVQLLLGLLPTALALGATEIDPDFEPLKDFDSNVPIDCPDTHSSFYLSGQNDSRSLPSDCQATLSDLRSSWHLFENRHDETEAAWATGLSEHLEHAVQLRVDKINAWIAANVQRFLNDDSVLEGLRRETNKLVVDLRANVQLCKMQCGSCQLLCIQGRHHDGGHNCLTSHHCPRSCQYADVHLTGLEPCGLPAGHEGAHMCNISEHRCGRQCHLFGRGGCLGDCAKVVDHEDEEHLCPAKAHDCGQACSLTGIRLSNGTPFSCPEPCKISSHETHGIHACENRSCPIPCQLCKRLCSHPNHLHGLLSDAVHLCGQDHSCASLCAAQGICQIETAPQSIEATFTGKHESFQYTKYSQASKRLPCVIPIPAGAVTHPGMHKHSVEKNPFHFCEARCDNCGYFCTLPLGHPQQEHETSHGSMSKTLWAVDGPDGTVLELNGRRFGAEDDGAPMLCSMVCQSMGRHVHIDYCRTDASNQPAQTCRGAELQHNATRMVPHPERAKDWITHSLYWRRSGFRDPYSQVDRAEFAKCDSMCGGPEHQANAQGQPQPSFCTLPMFHPPHRADQVPAGGGYVSSDGHLFSCRNPAVMQQAFHVIFIIDRSGSMGLTDRRPLPGTPVTNRIAAVANDRLGAVFSSLHAFWLARHSALHAQRGSAAANRRDAYSVVVFDHAAAIAVDHDFQSSPDNLLSAVLPHAARGGTDYTLALSTARGAMERHWAPDRSPVVIFLSDGECSVTDAAVQDLCNAALARGGSLSFNAVAFGPSNAVLRRMVQIATDVQARAPPDPLRPLVPSSYAEALDTVRLAETFLGLAESLRKPRGSLMST